MDAAKLRAISELDFDPAADAAAHMVSELPRGFDVFGSSSGGNKTSMYDNSGRATTEREQMMSSIHQLGIKIEVLNERQKKLQDFVERRMKVLDPLFEKIREKKGVSL